MKYTEKKSLGSAQREKKLENRLKRKYEEIFSLINNVKKHYEELTILEEIKQREIKTLNEKLSKNRSRHVY
ncbi:hypothetical protein RCL_jg6347.t1 [Rhizophagus clarus]|uniref:Uncharacterized protein n=1 Tax=Rhizophagus clarus TaxID=94130 RepID=A0A8H3L089_9GLOM|nr:hypothetical protein RCL_jg6347.t1 [Rhizophagus clarus]